MTPRGNRHPGRVVLIFPNQLFHPHPALRGGEDVYLIEHPAFFHDQRKNLRFHKMKLAYHRATMKAYAQLLGGSGHVVHYVDYDGESVLPRLFHSWKGSGISAVHVVDACDHDLDEELSRIEGSTGITIAAAPSPAFLTDPAWAGDQFGGSRHYSMTSFYIAQRKRLRIMVGEKGPLGGRWTFDTQNRKRLPGGVPIPKMTPPPLNPYVAEAAGYVEQRFPGHSGPASPVPCPVTHDGARAWMQAFIRDRLPLFGDYQDAMASDGALLFHSLLSPLLNVGLLTPSEVMDELGVHGLSVDNAIPLNSLEGFVRQIVGWREFMRIIYLLEGKRQREANFWDHHRPLPRSFYDGSTGILPVDIVVRRALDTGYAHHIERLMVLGNFMLLCEIDPAEVYRWFMEVFIDAYDWVMVPNVFGMSQYADGGLITTKPYLSSSNYILRMSDFPKGPWCAIWDGLYWRFIDKHRDFFAGNPRMAMIVKLLDRMPATARREHLRSAEGFLEGL